MASATMRINLGVAMGGKVKGMILHDAPAAPGSIDWQVPVGFVTGFGPNQGTMFVSASRMPRIPSNGPRRAVCRRPQRKVRERARVGWGSTYGRATARSSLSAAARR